MNEWGQKAVWSNSKSDAKQKSSAKKLLLCTKLDSVSASVTGFLPGTTNKAGGGKFTFSRAGGWVGGWESTAIVSQNKPTALLRGYKSVVMRSLAWHMDYK